MLCASLKKVNTHFPLLKNYRVKALTCPSDPILLTCTAYTKEEDHLAQECKAQDILPDKERAFHA